MRLPDQAGDLAGRDLEYLYSHTALAANGSSNTPAGWAPDEARADLACTALRMLTLALLGPTSSP